MRLTHRFILLIVPVISLFISCADDSVTQTGNDVTIHLTNDKGFDCFERGYFNYMNVSIGDYPVSVFDETGKSRFAGVQKPYDVVIFDWNRVYCYKNISIDNPQIVSISDMSFYAYTSCQVEVNMPLPGSTQFAIIKFVSKDVFREERDHYLFPNTSYSFQQNIDIRKGTSSIDGKFILVYCKGIVDYSFYGRNILEIYSFDSLSVKDVSLHPGTGQSITFSPGEMTPCLHESNIECITESIYPVQFTEAYMTFPGYRINSDLLVYSQLYFKSSFTVPDDFPMPYEMKLKSVIAEPSLSINPQVIAKGNTGSTFHLEHKEVRLIEPADDQTGINDNTIFSFGDFAEDGIYEIIISDECFIFTDQRQIRFGEFRNRGFNPRRNQEYFWEVYKYSTFQDISGFLNAPYFTNERFNRISRSEFRHFRTAE